MARKPKPHMLLRHIIVPVGRGRVGKTTLADSLFEEMDARGEEVTAWDVDRAPSLKRRLSMARRPTDGSDRARRSCLEDAIHETISGLGHAVVDMGADDLLFHQIQDKLPEMTELLAEAGVEVVGIHVLGPDADKDLAYYRATKDAGIFGRQIIALNHGMVHADINPDTAFANVRRIVNGSKLPVHVLRALPSEVIEAIWPEGDKAEMVPLDTLAGEGSQLRFVNRMVLRSFLNSSIGAIIDEILAVAPAETGDADG